MNDKMNILGIKMDCLSYADMHATFRRWLSNKESRSHSLALVNVNCCVSALLDKKLVSLYNSADMVCIDGMPFTRWARLFYNKKADRLYGPDVMLETCRVAKEYGYTFFLYGGMPEAPDKIEDYLKQRFDGIQVVGKYSPPFRPLSPEEDQEICDMINAARPDIVFVGLGSPKQDVWVAEHREKIRGSILIASGAAFDFFSGRIPQAPEWIRNAGFEWLYRLTKDFRRLWVRYTVYNLIFVFMFGLQLMGVRRFEAAE